jgi:hypothetical protein
VDRRNVGEPVGEQLLGDGVDQPGVVAPRGPIAVPSQDSDLSGKPGR